MSTFTGLTAVVTGAGSGIGRALSYQLAAEGAILAISDIDDLGLAETASHATGLGARVRADRLDVTDRDSVLAYADSLAGEFGAVHLVINNAGVVHGGDFLGMSFTDIERVVDVDFWGVVNGTKAFLPHLIWSTSPACSGWSRWPARAPMWPPSTRFADSPKRCGSRCSRPGTP